MHHLRWALLLLLPLLTHAQVPLPLPPGLQAWTAPTSPAPTITSVAAASNTAADNALCTAERPFYWEIGNSTSTLAFGSVGTPAVTATTKMLIASASKWVIAMYAVQLRGGVSSLTTNDINSLSQIDGYTNAPDSCGTTTITQCAAVTNAAGNNFTGCGAGQLYSYQNTSCPSGTGDQFHFSYNGWHFNNWAITYGGFSGAAGTQTALASTVFGLINPGSNFTYTQPQTAGGLRGAPADYAALLRLVLSNTLLMNGALGTHSVCTRPGANYTGQTVNGSAGPSSCPSTYAPITEKWQYSIGHWVETDPSTDGDGAFSSPGAFGFYPWVNAAKTYYGVVVPAPANNNSGSDSVKCGRLIRHAWDTGVEQTHTIPDQP